MEDTSSVVDQVVDKMSKAVFADWSLITLCALFFVGTVVASFVPFMAASYRNEYQVPGVGICASPSPLSQHSHKSSRCLARDC